MIKVLAIFDCNNGYTCPCHIQNWLEYEETYLSDDYVDREVKAYFSEHENDKKKLRKIYIYERELT